MFKRCKWVSHWAPLAFLFLFGYWVWWLDQPPDPLPGNAGLTEFSAERAMEFVRLLAQKPHRAGTPANDEVREKLLQILESQGLTIVTDEATVTRGSTVANPRNIYARLSGTGAIAASASRRAFALMAHYDSVPYGPGAADDLAGVAAMLETLRALKAGPALANDLLLIFTDGEECGLLGAKGFSAHPWAKETGCLLNFEARGVCGPSYLFELGEPKGWLVSEISRAKAPVRTSSLMFEVYRRLPFSTDFHMVRASIPGMNIAFIGRFPYYHSANDNLGNLDLGSLQHHGAYALAFARHFGNIPLNADFSKPAPTYFSLFGSNLFWYSKWWDLFLSILILTLLAFFRHREHSRGESGQNRVTRGIKAFSALLLIAAGSAALVLGAGWLSRGPYFLYQNVNFIVSGCFLSAAATVHVYGQIRRKLLSRHLTRSALFLGIGAMVLQVLLLPEGTFLWQWPLLAALLGIAGLAEFSVLKRSRLAFGAVFLLISIPILGFGVPFFSGLSEALGVFILPMITIGAVLGGGLLLPWLDRPLLVLKRPICGIGIVAGAVFFLAGIALSGSSASTPRMSHLLYHLNADTHQAHWCSVDPEPGAWTQQVFSAPPILQPLSEITEKTLWQSQAPNASLSAPIAELTGQLIGTDSSRVLHITLSSPRGANRLKIRASSKAPTLSGRMNGIPLETRGKEWSLDYSILPRTPVELMVVLQSNASLTLDLTDISYFFPVIVPPRPGDSIPMNNVLNRGSRCESDTTHVTKSFSF